MKTKKIFIKHQKNLGLCKTGVLQSSLKKADAKLLRYMDGHEWLWPKSFAREHEQTI